MNVFCKPIDWDTIRRIWQLELWPDRSSIDPNSAMVWPGDSANNYVIDISVLDYPVTYFGAFHDNQLIGVNSGHCTHQGHYRSRGLWVDPSFRQLGIAQQLFAVTQQQAMLENCTMLWSLPKQTAVSAYLRFGFLTQGKYFQTDTSSANIYVFKMLP